jgi:hypothetical protein
MVLGGGVKPDETVALADPYAQKTGKKKESEKKGGGGPVVPAGGGGGK